MSKQCSEDKLWQIQFETISSKNLPTTAPPAAVVGCRDLLPQIDDDNANLDDSGRGNISTEQDNDNSNPEYFKLIDTIMDVYYL
eukprot:12473024-Ditylum_brightwellii.AAC.1